MQRGDTAFHLCNVDVCSLQGDRLATDHDVWECPTMKLYKNKEVLETFATTDVELVRSYVEKHATKKEAPVVKKEKEPPAPEQSEAEAEAEQSEEAEAEP
jgi:hypothetical protein